MKFYADENFPLFVIVELRDLGHDVLTAFEDGRANKKVPDDEVLQRAADLRRVVLTINRKDFKKLHESKPNHAGICICTLDFDFIGQAKRIAEKVSEFEDANGQLIRVYRPN